MEIWSLFSGAMGLDVGFEQAGLKTSLVVELDGDCCETIRANKPDVSLFEGSVCDVDAKKLFELRGVEKEVDILIGGPPCQSFSTGGNRAGISDPRGNLVYEYLRLVDDIRPRYFVFENVANIVTATLKHRKISERPGKHWSLKSCENVSPSAQGEAAPLEPDERSGSAIRKILSDFEAIGYSLNFGILDAAEFGAPQHRLRFVMFGARDGDCPTLPQATHGDTALGLLPYTTVRDAIFDLQSNPGPHSVYTEGVEKYFRHVPVGGNWRSLPEDIKEEAMGGAYKSGGGKTGFYRRLPWDAPSPTITGRVNRKATALCHPESHRPVSVRECARLQGFPDCWTFFGSTSSQYLQIGNAVPVALGQACGKAMVDHVSSSVSLRPEMSLGRDELIESAVRRLRASARNKASRKKKQPDLFERVLTA